MSEITVEKSRAITVIAAATIVALAMGVGLAKVGTGFASRATNGITVTGSAKAEATADNAVWTLSVQQLSPTVSTAVTKVSESVTGLSRYLTNGGVKESELTLGAVSTYANEEYQNASCPTALAAMSPFAQRMLNWYQSSARTSAHFCRPVST